VVVLGVGLLAIALTLIVPPFVSELGKVGTSVEEGSRKAGELLRPLGVSQAEVDKAVDDGVKSVEGSGDKIAGGALAALNVLAAVLLTLVLTFFFVKDGRVLWGWIARLCGRHRDTAEELGERMWKVLTGYVHGVALVALIDALLIGLVLVLVGVPLAMPLTVMTFLAAFFPVVGAVVVGAAAVLVALVAEGGVAAAIVAGAILVVQQLDGNVLQPVLVGRRLELHPVVVLLALTAGGVIAGLVGAFVAVPLAAVAGAVIEYFRG
jgi:predicted PurR-regulated permease PerM